MLTLQPLRPDQYRQVAEWEFGPQPDDMDWQRYADEMNAPQWGHFGLYGGGEFVGCVSFERTDERTVSYHVVTARHTVHSQALAQVLLKVADTLFACGITALIVRIPIENRAAAILAIRCGMTEQIGTDKERHFMLTNQRRRF